MKKAFELAKRATASGEGDRILKAMVGVGAVARFTGFIQILVGVLGLTPQALRFRLLRRLNRLAATL